MLNPRIISYFDAVNLPNTYITDSELISFFKTDIATGLPVNRYNLARINKGSISCIYVCISVICLYNELSSLYMDRSLCLILKKLVISSG